MMKTGRYILTLALLLGAALHGFAQDPEPPTPTPTNVAFRPACLGGSVDPDSLIINGDFEIGTVGLPPSNWTGGSRASGLLIENMNPIDSSVSRFVMLQPGASIQQRLNGYSGSYTNFILSICAAMEPNSQIIIHLDGRQYLLPQSEQPFETDYNEEFRIFGLTVGNTNTANNPIVEIVNTGTGNVYIDNVELVEDLRPGGEETPEPSPTPEPPTPTAEPTDGPTPTPTPTLGPNLPTRTPTPKLTANSVQLVADPPMMVVTADDFASARGVTKQVFLDLQVIGSNGEPMNISQIDPDATVQFSIDTRGEATNVGRILQRQSSGNDRVIQTQKIKIADLGTDPIIFQPGKPFDGTVRIIVDIEYEADVNGEQRTLEIRGVVPIILRTDPKFSITGPTGSFNAARNAAAGRYAGDRGIRPDQRTNLFFRELIEGEG